MEHQFPQMTCGQCGRSYNDIDNFSSCPHDLREAKPEHPAEKPATA